jgi:hypothetical protein
MRKKNKIISLIALYFIFTLIYVAFFLFGIQNSFLFLALNIGSVAVLSTSTIYTVIQSTATSHDKIKDKKTLPKPKSIHADIFEEYFNALPLIEKYIESEESYEDIPTINKFIFSIFTQEEINKINQLDLSKIEMIQFIREMLYFDTKERNNLIEDMLNNKYNTDDIHYNPPLSTVEMKDQLRLYVRSLVEPGEKTKIIIVDTKDSINSVKEQIGILFNYNQENFHLSSGGILLNPNSHIDDYDIDDDDEIALIPSRKSGNTRRD